MQELKEEGVGSVVEQVPYHVSYQEVNQNFLKLKHNIEST